jgi:CRP-like cAMP-binding protein
MAWLIGLRDLQWGPRAGLRRSATARAIGPCRVSGLPVSDFRRSLQQRNGV